MVLTYLVDVVYQHYMLRIPLRRAVQRNLNRPQLGAHTNVILFERESETVHSYFWGPRCSRPFGTAVAPKCVKCGGLARWSLKKNKKGIDGKKQAEGKKRGEDEAEEEVTLACTVKNCTGRLTVKKPQGLLEVETDVQTWYDVGLPIV